MQQRDGVANARFVAVRVFTAEVLVLAVTGLWLVFFYRPSPAAAWPGMHLSGSAGVAGAVHDIHRLAAMIALPTAVVAGVLVVVDGRIRREGWRPSRLALVGGPALVIVTFLASFTGYLLPWDQLALRAVTVGSNMRGYGPVFRSSVLFALVGSAEVTRTTLLGWFLVHTVAMSVLLAGVLVAFWRPRRRQATDPVPISV